MSRPTASKKGLTLIEVLIAMVILSICAGALMVALARSLSVVRTARNREVARSLFSLVELNNPIDSVELDELSESGNFEDYDGYTWYRDIQMVDIEERPGLFLVTTRIQWAERGRDAFEEVTVFRYAPDAEAVTSQL